MKNIEMGESFFTQKLIHKIALTAALCISVFGLLTYSGTGHAIGNEEAEVSIRVIPENPSARETVTVLLSSFAFNINAVETAVYVDGKLIQREIGLKEFDFTVKDFGQESVIKIVVKKGNGDLITRQVSVIPSSVDLVYELDNPHVPFGYQGKSTAISNSALTIYAFPNLVNTKGQRLASDSLIYTWYKNYDIEPDNSGFGKSEYKIERLDAYPRETIISVKVTTLDGSLSAESKMVFNPQSSDIEFYLLDVAMPFSFKNIANPDIYSSYADTEILAVPYFMDDIESGEAEYMWTIGGKRYVHQENKDKNKVLLVNGSGNNFVTGVDLTLQIKNQFRFLQSVREELSISFMAENSGQTDAVFFNRGSVEEETGFFGL